MFFLEPNVLSTCCVLLLFDIFLLTLILRNLISLFDSFLGSFVLIIG